MPGHQVIVVDLDWSSTGLWSNGHGVPYDHLEIPPWLLARFEFWSWWHSRSEPWANPREGATPNGPDQALFDAYGLSLAIDLQRCLGTDYEVRYLRSNKLASGIPFPECIDEVWASMAPGVQPKSKDWMNFFPIHAKRQQA